MAYLVPVAEEVCAALTAAGLPAYTEYALSTEPVPVSRDFVTVGIADVRTGPVFRRGSTAVMPAECTLRLRFHCLTNADIDRLTILWELKAVPLLMERGFALTGMTLSPPERAAALNRFVREALCRISAAVLFDDDGRDSDA